MYLTHILQAIKLILTINLYLPLPMLKITHLPAISDVPNVFFNSEKEEKLFFLHIIHHLARGSLASGYFAEKSNSIFRAIICIKY